MIALLCLLHKSQLCPHVTRITEQRNPRGAWNGLSIRTALCDRISFVKVNLMLQHNQNLGTCKVSKGERTYLCICICIYYIIHLAENFVLNFLPL